MSRNESISRSRAMVGWQWVSGLVAAAAGVSVAVLLVPDFRLDGSSGGQLLAVLGIAVVVTAGTVLLPLPVNRWLRGAQDRSARAMATEPDLYASDREFFAPARRAMFLGFAGAAVRVAVAVVVMPVALWLSTWLGEAAGLPVRLLGFWPTVVAALVIAVVSGMAGSLLELLTGRSRGRRAVWVLARYGLVLGGLWLPVLVLGGVRLEPGSWTRQLLTLVVLAGLFSMISFELTVPFVTTILTIAINGLKLWFLSWFSTGLEVSLRISGFVNFLLAALIVTVVILLVSLVVRARERPMTSAPLPDPLLDHQPPMGPYY